MNKFILDTEENKAYMHELSLELLKFGENFASVGGGSYYLGDDGTPWTDRPRETWITCRMAHVYSIGHMMGYPNADKLAKKAIDGLLGELHDSQNGGWYAGLTEDNKILENKACYAHAFVILAGTSGVLAGIDGAKELLDDALKVYDDKFWCEEDQLARDIYSTDFKVLDDYRGLNANMHSVEAFLAVADVLGDEKYRERCGKIIDHVLGWAKENNWRIPEHFNSSWQPNLNANIDKPADPFKPYGATPGHGIEWARLISQWAISTFRDNKEAAKSYIEAAENLYNRAIEDAWNADGAPGICYTTDWNGKPVVHDRMHWTLAEAINTSATLYHITNKVKYSSDYTEFVTYLEDKVHDKVNGSWFHQLDENNNLLETVWPGKSDLYHAFQATLIPYNRHDLSIACAFKNKI